jgi:chaperonin GroES
MYTEIKKPVRDLDKLMSAPNVAESLDKEDVKNIGICAQEGYNEDKQSRLQWEERSATAMKLALQVKEAKTFPWVDAANVKFPLVTVAAIQFHARAYPALIEAPEVVKCRVIGEDPTGEKQAKAERLSTFMSWQCLEQDLRWEEEHDKGFLVEGIAGCMFIKKLFDPVKRRQETCLVLPNDFILNYYTKDLETSPRYTHRFNLSSNDVKQRELDGRYLVQDEIQRTEPTQDQQQLATNEREGTQQPPLSSVTPYETGEQYCWLDLDGDGYCEPYIVTFDIASGMVRSIVARYLPSGVKRTRKGEVYEITPLRIFTKYGFIPSPDGGFYDLGLGMLLGPLNESVNTALNQIFDAGTMATLGGGFLGRGFKGRGGPFTFRPFEWYPVDAPGDDLHKSILPLPVREPSNVLFQVLGLLIQYGERIVSATDIQQGENPGQNTPAETTRTLNANGARVYNAIYKRNWRNLRDEIRVQYDLNQLFLKADIDYEDLTRGQGAMVRENDFEGTNLDVKPAADPYIVSDTERVNNAAVVFKNSMTVPGHNRYQATHRLYKAMRISNIDEVLPPPMTQGPDGKPQPAKDYPPPPNPKLMHAQVEQAELQLKQKEFQSEWLGKQIELRAMVEKNQAEIIKLYAQAQKAVAEASGVADEHNIQLINARIGALKERNDDLLKLIEIVQKGVLERGKSQNGGSGVGGMETQPANSGVSGNAPGIGPNGAGGLAGQPVSFQ